jgi:HSP20 family protein
MMMYNLYRRPSAWREMERLRREMNRLFEASSFGGLRRAPSFPAMNAWSAEDGLVVTAEIPGVEIGDIEISVMNETLTLSGRRTPDEVGEGVRYHRRERGHGRFTRSLQLPYPVDADNVEATFKNGVLYIALPRAEEDKPRKITVKGAK